MNIKDDKYRLDVYSRFAQEALKSKLKWVVAHGCEGFPNTIGRDLDVVCYDEIHANNAVNIFVTVAQSDERTKYIIEPHPIWGRRVLAISTNFEVAELHILYKVNSGLLDCSVDWQEVDGRELFPKSTNLTFFKSTVMPLLGGVDRIEKIQSIDVSNAPWSLKHLKKKLLSRKKVCLFDKLLTYLQLGVLRKNIFKNLKYSLVVRDDVQQAPTTPLYILSEDDIIGVKARLDEIFMKIVCGDNMSSNDITYHQSRQRLVYMTKGDDDLELIDLRELHGEELCNEIVKQFFCYNRQKEEIYHKYFENRMRLL